MNTVECIRKKRRGECEAKCIHSKDYSEAAIQSIAKSLVFGMEGEGRREKREIDRNKMIGAEQSKAFSRKPAPKPPFRRQRHRHKKKRTESASVGGEDGGDEEEEGKEKRK
jgi:hypothetical protein